MKSDKCVVSGNKDYHFISFIYTHVQYLLEVPISHIGVIIMSHFFTFQVLLFAVILGCIILPGMALYHLFLLWSTQHTTSEHPFIGDGIQVYTILNKSLKIALEWLVLISADYR